MVVHVGHEINAPAEIRNPRGRRKFARRRDLAPGLVSDFISVTRTLRQGSSKLSVADQHVMPRSPLTFFLMGPVPNVTAITDLGREIPLFRYETAALVPPDRQQAFRDDKVRRELVQQAEQQFLANTKQDLKALNRLIEARPVANCHGWVFTGGQFGIHDPHIPSILADNGYVEVSQPRDGDLAIYRSGDEITHSGLVRMTHSQSPLVESKWGPFSVYLHAPDAHPFRGTCAFYRSPRAGHAITVQAKTK